MATLATIIEPARRRLDDMVEPLLWSNVELTEHLNYLLDDLCEEIPLIEDKTTAAFCTVSIAQGSTVLSISDRIVDVKRAKIASQSKPISRVTAGWMDAMVSDWESASQGEPQHLIVEGVGTNKVQIYPPADGSYTLNLTVIRLQTDDLVWDTDQNTTLEIPGKYHLRLVSGLCWMAYSKQDADTLNMKLLREFEKRWDDDKEKIKRSMLYRYNTNDTITAHPGAV